MEQLLNPLLTLQAPKPGPGRLVQEVPAGRGADLPDLGVLPPPVPVVGKLLVKGRFDFKSVRKLPSYFAALDVNV